MVEQLLDVEGLPDLVRVLLQKVEGPAVLMVRLSAEGHQQGGCSALLARPGRSVRGPFIIVVWHDVSRPFIKPDHEPDTTTTHQIGDRIQP